MSRREVAAPGAGMGGEATRGLYGKLPARGDFVRAGLPRDFIEPWDSWLQRVIAGSRAALGERWVPAWLEAPIWRFALPPGLCGAASVLGVWMPSVDRAGRHFPLTLAMTRPGGVPDAGAAAAFLACAEAAGLAALTDDLAPDAVMARLDTAVADLPAVPDLSPVHAGRALWWTEGAPLVPAGSRSGATLPTSEDFATMLDSTGTMRPMMAPADGADHRDTHGEVPE